MVLDAARDHDIDLGASWMIGDSKADVEAGKSVGCNTALLAGGERGAKEEAGTVAASLLEAVQHILQLEEVVADRDPHAKTRVRI